MNNRWWFYYRSDLSEVLLYGVNVLRGVVGLGLKVRKLIGLFDVLI